MLTQPDVERARQSIEAYNQGDFETLRHFYAENVVWHVAGAHRLAGEYQGRDQLFEYFATVRELTGGTLRLHPQSIVASADEIAMFTRVTAQRGGKELDIVLAQTLKVGADGRWTEYWAMADDQEAVDDFWSDERGNPDE
ncbi:MAG TPA: nuclear transport factor 2 family protein [Actinomycetota bacterium]|jgi:ketosteroid isomerase-like protein|nr:nuclear transport factor 2 family protein [Actinomycetota bacterium]